MAAKQGLKKYTGVYYTESKIRKWRERADRCFWVNFKDAKTGKLRWERCGWASEGWTPEAAQRRRYELLESDRAGDYKPKQERKQDQLTFKELMEKHYLPWGDENKKRAKDDRSLFKCWLEPALGSKTLGNISPLDLERVKKVMRDKGRAEASVRHSLCLVRQAYNRALEWKLWSGSNPCATVRFPVPNNSRQRFLTKPEADLLIEALTKRSRQVAQIAHISLFTGMRLREILALRWSDVNLAQGTIFIADPKNQESRYAFITPPVQTVLDELPHGNPDDFLFVSRKGTQVGWLSKIFKSVVDSIGLNKGISDPRQRISFHSLRHTAASWAVMSGTPLFAVGQMLGHKSHVMTQRYAHLSPDSQRAAFEAVSKFGAKTEETDVVNDDASMKG